MTTQRILVVDDTPNLLKLEVAILESGGFEVITATNGIDALDQLSKQTVDLIITDILMPQMDGYTLCYSVRNDERLRNIPIMIYSATYTSQSDEDLGISIGADLFIRKPASMSQLLSAVNDLLSARKPIPHGAPSPDLAEVMKQYNSRLIEKLEQKNQELVRANRLYSFVSAINQSIVHVGSEQELFDSVCDVAIRVGQFKMAWIGILDDDGILDVVSIRGDAKAAEQRRQSQRTNYNDPMQPETLIGRVLRTGKHAVSNDVQTDPILMAWWDQYKQLDIRSNISLPLMRSGCVVGVLRLNSDTQDFFDDEEVALLEGVGKDISFALDAFERERHRKRMQDEIALNEERLKRAQALAHFGSWELNFETGIAIWSDEACMIYGFSPSDNRQSYETWISFIHPDDLDYVLKMSDEGREQLRSQAFKHRIVRRDGTIRYVFSESNFEFDQTGKPIGMYGVVHDITERKEVEDALARSEANLRLIMDLMPLGIFAKDFDGRYLFVNKRFADLYELKPDQIVDRRMTEMIPVATEGQDFLEQDREVILSGVTRTIPESSFTDPHGNVHLFRTIKVPFTVAYTNEKAVLGISEDITGEKRAEEERNKIVSDIMQRNVDLEQFSYIVSHNLRAPVANIIGLADLICTADLAKENIKDFVAGLSDSAKSLDAVVKDLNLVLQVRQGVSYQWTSFSLSMMMADIRHNIENLISAEGVTLRSDFSAIDEILSIRSYIYSILQNLITNSIKYRRPNVPAVIEVSSELHTKGITLVVCDNGLGMDLDKIGNQLFGLYKRFHHSVEGKGMGLYMVKTQVQTLGGTINLTSKVNEGTVFKILFPHRS